MKLTRCKIIENHFYDREKYSCCPYCNPESEALIHRKNTYVPRSDRSGEINYTGNATVTLVDDVTVAAFGKLLPDELPATVTMYEDDEEEYNDMPLRQTDKPEGHLAGDKRYIPEQNGARCINCFNICSEEKAVCPFCGYNAQTLTSDGYGLYPGIMLYNRYIIGQVVGYGGFGITYKAWDTKLEQKVAIKEYFPSGIVNRAPDSSEVMLCANKRASELETGKTRFLNEAMAEFKTADDIVNVLEFFEENNTAYIVMEFLEGQTLKAYIQAHAKAEPDDGVRIMTVIGNALIKLHKKGIIHRDVSPDNIFICNDGKIKLIDFGAARFAENEDTKMTIILKPGFAPPEQYEKINKQGPWTDVYALGATMYYTLTGKKPEESTNRKVNDTLVYPHELNDKLSENLSNAIMKAMAIDVYLRYKTVNDFLEAINKNKPVIRVETERKRRRNRRFVGVAAALAVVGSGALYSFKQWNDEKQAETLPDSTLMIWYCKSGDEAADNAELAAYQAIADDFNSSFSNVSIKIEGFPESEYREKLKNADVQPNLYEYIGEDSKSKDLSVESVISSDAGKSCSLLGFAQDYYGNYNYLPLGYDAPLFFGNSTLEDHQGNNVRDITDLDIVSEKAEQEYMLDDNSFAKMYSLPDGETSDNAEEAFCNGQTAYLGTYSDKYFQIREKMPAMYDLMYCDTQKVYCKYTNVWCANDTNKDENKASLRFLEFMLGSNAQDEIHIQNNSHNIPINDNMIEDYTDVYEELGVVFSNRDKFAVEK